MHGAERSGSKFRRRLAVLVAVGSVLAIASLGLPTWTANAQGSATLAHGSGLRTLSERVWGPPAVSYTPATAASVAPSGGPATIHVPIVAPAADRTSGPTSAPANAGGGWTPMMMHCSKMPRLMDLQSSG